MTNDKLPNTGNPFSVSNEGANFIRRMEGERFAVYLDSAGLPTAGVGHLLNKAEVRRYAVGTIVPSVKINAWFSVDCAIASSAVGYVFYHGQILQPWQKNQTTFDALSSFIFNLGETAVAAGKATMARWYAGNMESFCESMLRWNKAVVGGQMVVVDGLTARRATEVRMIKEGKYS